MLATFLKAFIPLFVALDPIGLGAIFFTLGRSVPVPVRRSVARQAIATAAGVSLAFLFLGQTLFAAVGITVADFQVAGGLILLIIAGRDLILPASQPPADFPEGFGVVPLGMPLIAGPATVATLLALAPTVGLAVTFLAFALNLSLIMLAFLYSERLHRLVGAGGLRAISKIVSLLLAAVAVHMIRRGLTG